jgi:Polyketide cyclase / dehydrase and lipid transport
VVDYSELHVTRTTTVDAPPDAVFDIIADVTRIGELSPICKAAWWDEGAKPAQGSAPREGAWFTGRNEMEGREPWERRCEIVLVEPGRALGWIAGGRDEGVVEWTYRFRPVADGTEVEESWRVIKDDERITGLPEEHLQGLLSMTETGIEVTLANLKKIAEA